MKIYSDTAVTKTDIDSAISQIDSKQTREILQLRIMVGASFAINVVLTLALKFL